MVGVISDLVFLPLRGLLVEGDVPVHVCDQHVKGDVPGLVAHHHILVGLGRNRLQCGTLAVTNDL